MRSTGIDRHQLDDEVLFETLVTQLVLSTGPSKADLQRNEQTLAQQSHMSLRTIGGQGFFFGSP